MSSSYLQMKLTATEVTFIVVHIGLIAGGFSQRIAESPRIRALAQFI
jgi:hypothetical protein